MMKNGVFYRDSTLGCRVIQDFELCKLDNLWRHNVDQSGVKLQKIEYLSRLFLHKTETLYGCYTHHKVPWYVHCNISIAV